MKAMLGHDGPPTNFWKENLITGAPLARCPLRTMQLVAEAHPAVAAEVGRHVDRYYPAYKAGHLLEAGGIADQPSRYLDFMQEIALVELRVQAKARDIRSANQE